MKKIEQPFALSAYEKLEMAWTEYELAHRRYMDLVALRDAAVKGGLTADLYDFINIDGSMENLLVGLPRPCDGMACEALTVAQIDYLNATITSAEEGLKEFLVRIWESFKDWLLDWFDLNRYELRNAQDLLATVHTKSGVFGNPASFDATEVYAYTYSQWKTMLAAASELNKVIDKLPEKPEDLKDWVLKIKIDVLNQLKIFGKWIDDRNVIHDGDPLYHRNTITCVSGLWKLNEVEKNLNSCINMLDNEIANRKMFTKLERAFTSSDPTDRNTYAFLRKLVTATKKSTLHVSKSFTYLLNRVIRCHSSMYTIPKS